MQTFLPYSNFSRSAECLDDKRLGKQRIEALEILRNLRGYSFGWRNHPAVKMWEGYEDALAFYGSICCKEWQKRSFRDSTSEGFLFHTKVKTFNELVEKDIEFPPWLGDKAFHAAHRSVLLAKRYLHYSQFGWKESIAVKDESGRWPYIWPVS